MWHTIPASDGLPTASLYAVRYRAGEPASVRVRTHPAAGVEGKRLGVQPVVELLDGVGSRCVGDSTTLVHVLVAQRAADSASLIDPPIGVKVRQLLTDGLMPLPSLPGGVAGRAQAGVVTFSDIVVTGAADSVVLVFSSGSMRSQSQPFSVFVAPSTSNGGGEGEDGPVDGGDAGDDNGGCQVFDSAGNCCGVGSGGSDPALDECGVCNGDGSSCSLTVELGLFLGPGECVSAQLAASGASNPAGSAILESYLSDLTASLGIPREGASIQSVVCPADGGSGVIRTDLDPEAAKASFVGAYETSTDTVVPTIGFLVEDELGQQLADPESPLRSGNTTGSVDPFRSVEVVRDGVCGNGACEAGESPNTCPADCVTSAGSTVGSVPPPARAQNETEAGLAETCAVAGLVDEGTCDSEEFEWPGAAGATGARAFNWFATGTSMIGSLGLEGMQAVGLAMGAGSMAASPVGILDMIAQAQMLATLGLVRSRAPSVLQQSAHSMTPLTGAFPMGGLIKSLNEPVGPPGSDGIAYLHGLPNSLNASLSDNVIQNAPYIVQDEACGDDVPPWAATGLTYPIRLNPRALMVLLVVVLVILEVVVGAFFGGLRAWLEIVTIPGMASGKTADFAARESAAEARMHVGADDE